MEQWLLLWLHGGMCVCEKRTHHPLSEVWSCRGSMTLTHFTSRVHKQERGNIAMATDTRLRHMKPTDSHAMSHVNETYHPHRSINHFAIYGSRRRNENICLASFNWLRALLWTHRFSKRPKPISLLTTLLAHCSQPCTTLYTDPVS